MPGLSDLFYNGNQHGDYYTKDDGSYQIPVLTGPGLVNLHAEDSSIRYSADDQDSRKPNEAMFVPYPYGLGSAWAEIRPAESATSLIHDFVLKPGPSKTVTGSVFDTVGKPLPGVRYCGLYAVHSFTRPQQDNRFTVTDLQPSKARTLSRLLKIRDPESLGAFLVPEESRPVVFMHGGKRLAGYKEIGWDTPEPIEVQLEPWGVVTGRLVDSAGLPRPNCGMQPHLVLKNRLRHTEVPHWQERVFTDASGRFRVEGLVPGQSYRLVYENASSIQTEAGCNVAPLKPSETRDLGDIKAVVPGEDD